MKKEKITIVEKVAFKFGHYENVVNVLTALASSGYYVKVRKEDSSYVLLVYTDRE